MVVRVDKRTPSPLWSDFNGIKLKSSYSYLGVTISDDLNLTEHLESIKRQECNLAKIKWILEKQNSDLNGASKFHFF